MSAEGSQWTPERFQFQFLSRPLHPQRLKPVMTMGVTYCVAPNTSTTVQTPERQIAVPNSMSRTCRLVEYQPRRHLRPSTQNLRVTGRANLRAHRAFPPLHVYARRLWKVLDWIPVHSGIFYPGIQQGPENTYFQTNILYCVKCFWTFGHMNSSAMYNIFIELKKMNATIWTDVARQFTHYNMS